MSIFDDFFEDAKEKREKREKTAIMRRKADNAAKKGFDIIRETKRNFLDLEYDIKRAFEDAKRNRENYIKEIETNVVPQLKEIHFKVGEMENDLNLKEYQGNIKLETSFNCSFTNPIFPGGDSIDIFSIIDAFFSNADDEYYEAQSALYEAESYLEDAKRYREQYIGYKERREILKKYLNEEKRVLDELRKRFIVSEINNKTLEELKSIRGIWIMLLEFINTKIIDNELKTNERYKELLGNMKRELNMGDSVEYVNNSQENISGFYSLISKILSGENFKF